MMRLVFTTFSHPGDAARVIHTLVEEKLIACGTILPKARSIYTWQGKMEDCEEAFVILKTMADQIPALETRLHALHPFETPEFVVLTPDHVAEPYLQWVRSGTQD